MKILQQVFMWFCERRERFGNHLVDTAEYVQRMWATVPLPLAIDREGLENELQQIRQVRNPIQELLARERKMLEMLTRLDIAEEPKNGVWLAGPKSASH